MEAAYLRTRRGNVKENHPKRLFVHELKQKVVVKAPLPAIARVSRIAGPYRV